MQIIPRIWSILSLPGLEESFGGGGETKGRDDNEFTSEKEISQTPGLRKIKLTLSSSATSLWTDLKKRKMLSGILESMKEISIVWKTVGWLQWVGPFC